MYRKFRRCLRPVTGRLGRVARLWLAVALALPIVPLAVLASAPPAAALGNGLALTPPMGWNDWNAYGCNVSEQLVEQTALAMHNDGMQAAGYQYVNIDDCWMSSSRDASGNLVANPSKFPDGIAAVASYVHSLGLKLGIYEDAGTATCAGYPGSYGHEQQDANLFASWGVDYLKYDWCNIPFSSFPGQSHQQVAQTLYTRMRNALAATGRPIVFSMCNGWGSSVQPWTWGGTGRRTCGAPPATSSANFASMLNNFHINVGLASFAGPGRMERPGHARDRQWDERHRGPVGVQLVGRDGRPADRGQQPDEREPDDAVDSDQQGRDRGRPGFARQAGHRGVLLRRSRRAGQTARQRRRVGGPFQRDRVHRDDLHHGGRGRQDGSVQLHTDQPLDRGYRHDYRDHQRLGSGARHRHVPGLGRQHRHEPVRRDSCRRCGQVPGRAELDAGQRHPAGDLEL